MWKLRETKGLDATAIACAVALAAVGVTASFAFSTSRWMAAVGPMAVGLAVGARWKHRIALAALGMLSWPALANWAARPTFQQAAAGVVVGALFVLAERWRRGGLGLEKATTAGEIATLALGAVAWPLIVNAMLSAESSALATSLVPPEVLRAAVGACAGLLAAMASVPLYVKKAGDPVSDALSRMRPSLDTDLRALLLDIVEARTRTLRLLEQSTADARTREETSRGLEALALASIELAHRFSSVHHVLSRLSPDHVAQRAEALRAQLGEATDAGVRRDLERAAASLDEQRDQLERLRQGRLRLLARLESELASLEKTEVSLALLASGDAALSGVRLEAIGSSLGRQAQELAAEGHALQETLAGPPSEAVRRAIHA